MINQLECPALRIGGFRFWVVAGDEPHAILGEGRVDVESRVRLV
jgi:hypothetical protein